MTVRVVFFILKLVRKFWSAGDLNTAWNREKIAMSQGFACYWVTVIQVIVFIGQACIALQGNSRGVNLHPVYEMAYIE